MRKIAVFTILVLLLALGATPVLADGGIPKLPHAFYGSVTVNGVPALDGTQISATIDIGTIISTQNPVTTVGGNYGIGRPYLLVQGYDIPDGATITFHITNAYGTAIDSTTAAFVAGGGPTLKNLSVNISGGGGGGGAGALQLNTNLFGSIGVYTINSEGIIQQQFQATSADGMLTVTIPAGTKALDKDGHPLLTMTAAVFANPPAPPENAYIIGLAYDFLPAGATFDPPITFTWTYDPLTLPTGVAEADLDIAYYDTATGTWIQLHGTVNTTTHTITAQVSHFTTFAIIGTIKPAAFALSSLVISPAQVASGETVNINLSVANTGGLQGSYTVVLNINGVKETEKSVTVAAGGTQAVSFSVTKTEAGSYSVTVGGLSGSFTVLAPPPTTTPPATTPPVITPTTTPPATTAPAITPPATTPPAAKGKAFNWPLVGGIIGGVVIIILVIVLLTRRRD